MNHLLYAFVDNTLYIDIDISLLFVYMYILQHCFGAALLPCFPFFLFDFRESEGTRTGQIELDFLAAVLLMFETLCSFNTY